MAKGWKYIDNCRACGSADLKKVMSLGNQRVVDFVQDIGASSKPTVPLELTLCMGCKLLQLSASVDPDILYTKFWYRSGISESMRTSLLDVVKKSSDMIGLEKGDKVLDIGANDGTMLSMYPPDILRIGIDPSDQIVTAEAMKRMTASMRAYFNRQSAEQLVKNFGQFSIITAIAMFYDLEDPVEFLRATKAALLDDGLLVIQMNYLVSMLQMNAIDNVCHEHLAYYSLHSLEWVTSRCGFSILDVELNGVNGGSLRVYLKKSPTLSKEYPSGAIERIQSVIDRENQLKLDDQVTYLQYGSKIRSLLHKLSVYITQQTLKGKKCYAYGASTRGTVLLQLTPLPLAGVAERDQQKWGLRMVDPEWLKIHSEEYVRGRADIMLVLPWHFQEQIIAREKDWLDAGGTLVFPLPEPVAVTKDGAKELELDELRSLKIPMKEINNAATFSTDSKMS